MRPLQSNGPVQSNLRRRTAVQATAADAETVREEVPREVASARAREARVVVSAAETARGPVAQAEAAVPGRPRLRLGTEQRRRGKMRHGRRRHGRGSEAAREAEHGRRRRHAGGVGDAGG